MKLRIFALALALLLCAPLALADNGYEGTLEPIEATLNQKMALRSGPGTKYTELGTYPKDTPITLYEQEIGGTVSWGQLEFHGNGGLIRAYTGMKRIDASQEAPWANTVTRDAVLTSDVTPRRGPGENYAPCGQSLGRGARLTLYHEENGYVTADFTFPGDEQLTRAWIPADCVSTDLAANAGSGTDGFAGSTDGGGGIDWNSGTRKGAGYETPCTRCFGSGQVDCSNCDGRGYKEKYVSTPNYSGHTKTTSTVREDCFKCGGRGKVDCSACGGDGWK